MYHDVFMISKESLTDTFGTTPEMQPKSCHFFVTPLGIFLPFFCHFFARVFAMDEKLQKEFIY